MSIAFWSVELKKGKPVEVQPPEGYVLNLQNAAVTGGEGTSFADVSQVSRVSHASSGLRLLLRTN